MKQKQKTHDPIPQGTIPGEPGGDELAEAREKMNAMLAVADGAVDAGLSTDSGAFLDKTKQRGGQ